MQQCFDCAARIHRAMILCHLLKRQRQIKDLAVTSDYMEYPGFMYNLPDFLIISGS